MQAEKTSHGTKIKEDQDKRLKLNLHEQRNWSIQIEELSTRITPTISDLQSGEQRR